jgi:hypothetical protein
MQSLCQRQARAAYAIAGVAPAATICCDGGDEAAAATTAARQKKDPGTCRVPGSRFDGPKRMLFFRGEAGVVELGF